MVSRARMADHTRHTWDRRQQVIRRGRGLLFATLPAAYISEPRMLWGPFSGTITGLVAGAKKKGSVHSLVSGHRSHLPLAQDIQDECPGPDLRQGLSFENGFWDGCQYNWSL